MKDESAKPMAIGSNSRPTNEDFLYQLLKSKKLELEDTNMNIRLTIKEHETKKNILERDIWVIETQLK